MRTCSIPSPALTAAWCAVAAALLFAATPAAAAPAWITLGDRAYDVLRTVAPQTQALASRQVPVMLPAPGNTRATVRGSEGVHAVEVDDALLPALSHAVHEQLQRCGGYLHHDSMAEALATLHRLDSMPQPARVPSYTLDDGATVTPLLAQAQASRILDTIQTLSDFQNRLYNSSHGVAASDWLATQWRALAAGRRDVQVSLVRHSGWPQKSVSLFIRGSDNAAETVVLGAHLDSIAPGGAETARAPGADDDASGVASLTEVIRVLLAAGYRPQRSIQFYAYAAEEVGLRGSQQLAARAQAQRAKKPVVGVLQLDMTAFQGDATDLWIFTDYTDAAQNAFVADLAATYLPQLSVGYDRCGYGCSDHAAWTARGFAASFPFEASDAHFNRALHTDRDTPATFGNQADHALKFAQLALAFAVELGSDGR